LGEDARDHSEKGGWPAGRQSSSVVSEKRGGIKWGKMDGYTRDTEGDFSKLDELHVSVEQTGEVFEEHYYGGRLRSIAQRLDRRFIGLKGLRAPGRMEWGMRVGA